MLASPGTPRSPRPSALDASEAAAGSFAAAFGTLSGLGLAVAVESCPWADHQVEPYMSPSPPPRPASPPARTPPSEPSEPLKPSEPAADEGLAGGGAETARVGEDAISGESRLAPASSTGPSLAADGGRDDAPESGLRIAAPDMLDEGDESGPGHTSAEDGPFDGGTEEGDVGDERDGGTEEDDVSDERDGGAEEATIYDSPEGGTEEDGTGGGRDVAAEKGDTDDVQDIATEEGDTGDGWDISTEEGDTGDGLDIITKEGDTGDCQDIAAEEGDTGYGRNVATEKGDTGDGRDIAAEEGDTGDRRAIAAEEGDTGERRAISTEESDTGDCREIGTGEGDNGDVRDIAAAVDDTGDGMDLATDEGGTTDRQDIVTEGGVTVDGGDAKDEDADDYASCFTGTPSPLGSLSPMPCDKEADGGSEGALEDFDFDDFASCVDEYDFSDCGDSFETFASARASLSVSGTEDYARILESLSVAEVDFQRLTDIVLDSAYWFANPLPKASSCCDVELPGSWRQNSTHQVSDSDRLGGDGCVELLACLTSASPFVNPNGEASAGFEWKTSVLCSLFSAAANPSCRVEDGRSSPPAPAASGSTRPREAPRTRDAINGSRGRASGPSACAGNEGTARPSETAGGVPGSGSSQPTGSGAAASPGSANAGASPAKNLDLAHVRQLCGVSKAALMKRRAEELSLLRDHYAKVLENATLHLRRWLDDKEQADMRSEMNHKIIEALVLEAQKAVSEKSTVHGDVKRRKVVSVRTPRKPPKVEQGEQAVGLRVRLPR